MALLWSVLTVITSLWPLLVALFFWIGVRRRSGWSVRLWSGITWAFGMWVVAGLARWALTEAGHSVRALLLEPQDTKIFVSVGGVLAGLLLFRLVIRAWQYRQLQDINLALARLQELCAKDFEVMVARYLKSLGYVVRRVGKSGDHGVDLAVYTPKDGKWIVQCKCYQQRTVGEAAIRDLYGAMLHEHADRGIIFTSSTFSVHARDWAQDKPIELVDGEVLVERLKQRRIRYQSALRMQIKP